MGLPTMKQPEDELDKLFIFSYPKVGKTTLISGLKNNLIIDTENGSKGIGGLIVNTIIESRKQGISESKVLGNLSKDIIEANNEKGDFVYDFITIDTGTGLERIAKILATAMYKQTGLGKSYKGNDVTVDLEYGAGWQWLRTAYDKLIGLFDGLSRYGLILTGHTKLSSIPREGKEFQVQDINLSGKLKDYITRNFDAVGLLERDVEDNNKVFLTFEINAKDLATGSRIPRLNNKRFLMSQLTKKGFEFHWENIYNLK